ADDVENWLADEPVSAWREPARLRWRRWARRHLPLVAGAAGLLVASTVALAAGAALLQRANARTGARRLEAERDFTPARQAVDRFFTRVSEERLLNEPAMLRLRKDLLSTAREFYQRFVDERRHDPAVRAELGESHLRLLLISRALGEVGEGVK